MRRRTLFKSDSGLLNGNLAEAVFYDSNSNSFITMTPDEITGVIDGYTPIGVVVIPAEHDVYGDGTCGVMSLVDMDVTSKGTGRNMYWGGMNTDTSLPNYDMINLVDGTTNSMGYLPSDSDRFTGATSLDGVSKYNTTSKNAPSPYNYDGSRNEAYYTTAYSTSNVLSDFDGVGNTKVLTDLATGQSDWKTATTITNDSGAGYYPAACCCWRFHTAGTEQGQWYLPAAGELGYAFNRVLMINATIDKIKSIYSSVVTGGFVIFPDVYYWASTEYNAERPHNLGTSNGGYYASNKSYTCRVRAFLRL